MSCLYVIFIFCLTIKDDGDKRRQPDRVSFYYNSIKLGYWITIRTRVQ